MLRILLIICLLSGAASTVQARPSDFEFATGLAIARFRLSLGTLTSGEAAWLQGQIDKYVKRYSGKRDNECWIFAYRLGITECGTDCDCTGRAVYQLLAPYSEQFRQRGIKTPYGGGR